MGIFCFLICCMLFTSSFPSVTQASVNLAFHKPAVQSTTVDIYNASLAVDGNHIADFNAGSCTHTLERQLEAWWQVDLQTISEIISVIIYSANDRSGHPLNRRLNGFQLFISTDPTNWRNTTPCYNDTEPGDPPMNTTVECKELGQFATLYTITTGSREANVGPLLLLCEVEVIGCKAGTYGNKCNENCPANCVDNRCDPDTSQCFLGCDVGWMGQWCDIRCDVGLVGQRCDIQCINNTFGFGCSSKCNCAQGDCHHVNGVCAVPGCQSGWRGDTCSETCLPNTFGRDCVSACHCLNGSCERMSGICFESDCLPGWIGNTCSEECINNTFGLGCNSKCNCVQGGCDQVTGVCFLPGCQAGWQGVTCSESCDNGTFGYNCESACYCFGGNCNHINGMCETPGCILGWTGQNCRQRIRDGSDSKSFPVIGIVTGILVAFILAVAVIIALIIYVRRQPKADSDKQTTGSQIVLFKRKDEDKEAKLYMDLNDRAEISPTYSALEKENVAENACKNIPKADKEAKLYMDLKERAEISPTYSALKKENVAEKAYENIPKADKEAKLYMDLKEHAEILQTYSSLEKETFGEDTYENIAKEIKE